MKREVEGSGEGEEKRNNKKGSFWCRRERAWERQIFFLKKPSLKVKSDVNVTVSAGLCFFVLLKYKNLIRMTNGVRMKTMREDSSDKTSTTKRTKKWHGIRGKRGQRYPERLSESQFEIFWENNGSDNDLFIVLIIIKSRVRRGKVNEVRESRLTGWESFLIFACLNDSFGNKTNAQKLIRLPPHPLHLTPPWNPFQPSLNSIFTLLLSCSRPSHCFNETLFSSISFLGIIILESFL